MLENDTVSAQSFRVMSVEERDGISYGISALAYVNEKYAFIEDGETITPQQISTLNLLKPPPEGLDAEETIVLINNQPVSKLIIRWKPVTGVSNYMVNYRFDDNNIVSATTSSPDFEIFNTKVGSYEVSVRSLNSGLEPSATDTSRIFNTVGKTAVPADVTGLTGEPISKKTIRLRWNLATDLDVTHGGRVYVRHSSKTDGTGTFSNATDLVEGLAGNTTIADVPLLEGEYILKFQDDGGRFSNGEASVIVDLPDTVDDKLIQTRREDLDVPKFQGTKTNVAFDATTNSLNLTGTGQFDSITDFDVENSIDDIGGIAPLGTYEFGGTAGGTTLDLGDVFSIDLKRHFLTEAFYPSDLFDSVPNLDVRDDFDGLTATDVNAEMLVRVTQDNPNTGSPTYGPFQTFANGTYKGRGFQFKVNLTSNDAAQDIRVFELGYTASMEQRTEQSPSTLRSVDSNNNPVAKAVTFQHPFFVGTANTEGGANSILPSVGITAQNMQSGDFFEISNVSGTGFTVHFKNSSNASVDRNFTYQAVGFGKAS